MRKHDTDFKDTLLVQISYFTDNDCVEIKDEDIRKAMEKSMESFFRQKEIEKQQRMMEMERKMEKERVETLHIELGILISRLQSFFEDDPVAQDLLVWINRACTLSYEKDRLEWECKYSPQQVLEWTEKNLNPVFKKLVREKIFV